MRRLEIIEVREHVMEIPSSDTDYANEKQNRRRIASVQATPSAHPSKPQSIILSYGIIVTFRIWPDMGPFTVDQPEVLILDTVDVLRDMLSNTSSSIYTGEITQFLDPSFMPMIIFGKQVPPPPPPLHSASDASSLNSYYANPSLRGRTTYPATGW